jgi:hypothetical protein
VLTIRAIRLAAALACLTAPGLAAQSDAAHWLHVAGFMARRDANDAAVSPMHRGGWITGRRLGYERLSRRTLLRAGLDQAGGRLSAGKSDASRSEFTRVAGDASLLARVSYTVMAGVEVAGTNDVTDQVFALNGVTERFETSALWLAPTVDWVPLIFEGRVTVRASVAAVARVRQPWSREKASDGTDVPAMLGAGAWRHAALEVMRDASPWSRVALRVGYRGVLRSTRHRLGSASVDHAIGVTARLRVAGDP